MSRPDRHDPAISQHDFQLVDMIRGSAINWRVGAARIIGDHPAEGGPRAGRHVRPEAKPMRTQQIVQMIQHHARPHAHRAPLQIQLCDFEIVPREIDHQAVTNGTADQARARAARNDADSRLRCRFNQTAGLAGIARKGHAHRLDLVNGRIGGIELPRQVIECNGAIRACQR